MDNYIQATQEANNATDPPKKIVNPTDNTRVASKAIPSKGKLTSNYFQEANNKAYWKDFYAKKGHVEELTRRSYRQWLEEYAKRNLEERQ